MDTILDRYSCYKVETIGQKSKIVLPLMINFFVVSGDAYMVVSGVPKLNGRNHSSEICTMALDVLREISEIIIPHMPNEHLFMRIGIHTGTFLFFPRLSCTVSVRYNKEVEMKRNARWRNLPSLPGFCHICTFFFNSMKLAFFTKFFVSYQPTFHIFRPRCSRNRRCKDATLLFVWRHC